MTNGGNAATICPQTLWLTTPLVDDRRRSLLPGHERFGLFAWAWKHQGSWTLGEHEEFWAGTLGSWPVRGKPARVERLAWQYRHHHRVLDLDPAAAAGEVGYALDDLRRMGVLRVCAEELPAPNRGTVVDLSTGLATRDVLPWIYATHERAPNPDGFPNLPVAILEATPGDRERAGRRAVIEDRGRADSERSRR